MRESLYDRSISAAALLGGATRLVVVAPHPDDEVLAAGGWLAECSAMGIATMVILVTDGEASHPGSSRLLPASLAYQRPRETARALHMMHCVDTSIVRLRLRDGNVEADMASLVARLSCVLRDSDVVVVPWRFDGHPDHEAVARAGIAVSDSTGCMLREAPIWMWRWRCPDDPAIPWTRARRLDLSALAASRKRAAMKMFSTQTERDASLPDSTPVVPPAMIDALCRGNEIYFV